MLKYFAVVKFNNVGKKYVYNIGSNVYLELGKSYFITADNKTTYDNPVTVVDFVSNISDTIATIACRTITKAVEIKGRRPNDNLKKIIFDEDAGVTVALWDDGTKTIIRCQEDDIFDKEKAIALCYMKKALGNRGSFNETIKKWVK